MGKIARNEVFKVEKVTGRCAASLTALSRLNISIDFSHIFLLKEERENSFSSTGLCFVPVKNRTTREESRKKVKADD